MVRGRQWRGGVRNLGLNLALPLQGAGPPVHLDAKERRNEYAARAVIGPPRPPPPPPHYNFPNRILQSGPYSLAHKQFCFSALEPVNHAEREHLGRRRGPPRALPRAPHRAPPNGFVPGGRGVLGWRATGARCGVPRPGKMGNARRKRVRVWGAQRSGFEFRSDVFWLRPWATSPPPRVCPLGDALSALTPQNYRASAESVPCAQDAGAGGSWGCWSMEGGAREGAYLVSSSKGGMGLHRSLLIAPTPTRTCFCDTGCVHEVPQRAGRSPGLTREGTCLPARPCALAGSRVCGPCGT